MAIRTSMTWTALTLVLVMVLAGSRLARHSLTLLAALASIAVLVWLLAIPDRTRDSEQRGKDAQAGLTSRAIP